MLPDEIGWIIPYSWSARSAPAVVLGGVVFLCRIVRWSSRLASVVVVGSRCIRFCYRSALFSAAPSSRRHWIRIRKLVFCRRTHHSDTWSAFVAANLAGRRPRGNRHRSRNEGRFCSTWAGRIHAPATGHRDREHPISVTSTRSPRRGKTESVLERASICREQLRSVVPDNAAAELWRAAPIFRRTESSPKFSQSRSIRLCGLFA